MQAECSDYDTWLNRPLYDSLLEKAALRAEQMMSRQKGDPWDIICGNCLGLPIVFRIRGGKLVYRLERRNQFRRHV